MKTKEIELAIELSRSLKELAEPLKILKTNIFTYLRIKGKDRIYLSNNPLWVDDYYKKALYKTSAYENETHQPEPGVEIWTPSDREVIKHGINYFNSAHGVTIIKKLKSEYEFFFFTGTMDKTWLTNFYLNNLDLLYHFIAYFQDKSSDLLEQASQCPIQLPQIDSCEQGSEKKLTITQEQCRSFLEQTTVKKYYLDETRKSWLTTQEYNITSLLLSGCVSSKEIARKLSISSRTAEEHINNIRIKLKCTSKNQIIEAVKNTKLFNHLESQKYNT